MNAIFHYVVGRNITYRALLFIEMNFVFNHSATTNLTSNYSIGLEPYSYKAGLILGVRPANERRLLLAGLKPRISPVKDMQGQIHFHSSWSHGSYSSLYIQHQSLLPRNTMSPFVYFPHGNAI